MYVLTYSTEYEGSYEEIFYNMSEIEAWLRANRSSYDYNLDNVSIYKIEESYNPYEVIQGNYKE